MAAPGTDIAFNARRTAGYRNLANKISNASRFMFMNLDRVAPALRPDSGGSAPEAGIAGFEAAALEDRWILSRFSRVAGEVNDALEAYRFDDAARAIYDFFWGELCDWYIELIKPRLTIEDSADRVAAQRACRNLANLFEASIRLLHPVMPFITEEIWHALYDGKPPLKSVALASYPAAQEKQLDSAAETEMGVLRELIVSVRNLRAELAVEQKLRVPIQIFAEEPAIRSLIEQNRGAVERLAGVEKVTFAKDSLAKLSSVRHTARFDVHVVYDKKIDVTVERGRLKKELERIEKEIANVQRQLGNDQFLAKAPAQVVEGLRKREPELAALREKTQSKLHELR